MDFDKIKRVPSKLKKLLKKNLKLVITDVKTSEKVIGLTFDDGPHPEYTPAILDLLNKYQAKATFFVVGEAAQKHSSVVKKIVKSGHALGNHSWNHSAMPLISRKERFQQIRDTQQASQAEGEMLFRPPWGFLTLSSYIDIRLLGYKIVYWDRVAYDWLDHTAEDIFHQLDLNVKPGSILLLHDNLYNTIKPEYVSRCSLIKGLEMFFEKYAHDYKFVTVPQLLDIGNPNYKYGLYRKEDKDSVIPKIHE